jgi:pimeloyl-ACP methyl ester carboxylesterase
MRPEIKSKWREVQGIRVHYLTAGESGSPVLLLHGGGRDSGCLTYRQTMGPLAEHHRVFALDWPGYGESDTPDLPYSNGCYVDFLGRFMDSLGLKSASLVGLSLGGGASLGLALQCPERVDKLVLVDSYGLGQELILPAVSYRFIRSSLLYRSMERVMDSTRPMVRLTLGITVIHDRRRLGRDVIERVWRQVNRPGAGRAWRVFQTNEVSPQGLRTNYVTQLGQVRVPTLIVHGDHDRVLPVAWARRAHKLIPNSRLRVIPDCGHWPPVEKPEVFNEAVVEFLAEDAGESRVLNLGMADSSDGLQLFH